MTELIGQFKEKAKTLLWFAKRPVLWRQSLRLAKRKIINDDEKGRQKSKEWCKMKATDLQDFLLSIQVEYLSFRELNPDSHAYALKIYEDSRQDLGGGANLDLLYSLSLLNNVKNILETGVAYGWSSLAILAALNKKEEGNLVSVDMPYPKMNNEDTVGIVIPDELKSQWSLISEADITGIPKGILLHKSEIDLCHYDSDKSYQGRMWAYPLLWNSLRSGGFLISDDIQDNIAFQEFCASAQIDPVIIEYSSKFLGVLIKPKLN